MNLLQGTILSPDGKPIAGASVFISRAPVSVPDIAQLSDAKGRFSLTVPMKGAYTLQVATTDFQTAEVDVKVTKQKESLTVRLKR